MNSDTYKGFEAKMTVAWESFTRKDGNKLGSTRIVNCLDSIRKQTASRERSNRLMTIRHQPKSGVIRAFQNR